MGWSHNLCKDLGNYRYDALTTSWVKAYQDAENVRDGAETQKQINDKSVRVFESIADLLTYTPRKDGQVVYVKGYHNPTNFALAKPYVGGGHRVYVASRAAENDGFYVSMVGYCSMRMFYSISFWLQV